MLSFKITFFLHLIVLLCFYILSLRIFFWIYQITRKLKYIFKLLQHECVLNTFFGIRVCDLVSRCSPLQLLKWTAPTDKVDAIDVFSEKIILRNDGVESSSLHVSLQVKWKWAWLALGWVTTTSYTIFDFSITTFFPP